MVGAGLFTTVVAVALSLPATESTVTAVTVAVLLNALLPLIGVTTSVIVAEAVLAMTPRLHDCVVVPVQLPCDGVLETNVTPAGNVSLTVTPVAVSGPALLTVMVYVRLLPAVIGSGASVIVIPRFADPTTPELFPHQVPQRPFPLVVPGAIGVAAYSCIVHISRSLLGSTTVEL